jgi:tetratricopeptide (TPR) repeat protein
VGPLVRDENDLTGRLMAALRAGDLTTAEPLAERLAHLRPKDGEATHLRGLLALQQDRGAAAVALLRQAVALRPADARCHANLSTALRRGGQTAAAELSCRHALRLAPAQAELHYNLANVLRDQNRLEAARAALAAAVALAPDSEKALYNLGNLLNDLLRPGEAAAALRRAVALGGPLTLDARLNLGRALERLEEWDAAQECYQAVLASQPDHVHANWNLSLLQLRRGDLANGFRRYEWRWRLREHPPRPLPRPLWDGQPAAGETVLIHAEQGLGDSLQFCRYLPEVARRAGRVVFECPPALTRLMRQSFPGITVVETDAQPDCDRHAPLMSLPLLLGTNSVAAIPAPIPYLRAAEPVTLPGDEALKVGLVWAGSPGHNLQRALHAIPLDDLAPILAVPGIRFFSLQKGPEAEALATRPELPLTDLAPRLDDFADTAAFAAALDLIITIDTSVAHLAGGLGRPAWVMLRTCPDWRWLLDRDDSPWYPTLRLFRQRRLGDWRAVTEAVAAALRTWAGHSTRTTP